MRLLFLFLTLFSLTILSAQNGRVTGVVTGDGAPLIGVSILQEGTTNGTVTDVDGSFSIYVGSPRDSVKLVFSYIGYGEQSRWVTKSTTQLKVDLTASSQMLDEVVVRTFRVPLMQQDNTSSGQTITSEELRKLPTRRHRRKANKRTNPPAKETTPTGNVYDKIVANEFINTRKEPVSTLSTDVDRAAYANVRSYLRRGQLPPADAVRIEEMINYFPYETPRRDANAPIELLADVIPCPWRDTARLLRVTATAPRPTANTAVNHNLVFLLDVSGSMQGPGRLPLVKQSIRMLTRQLTANDRISIVVYAGAAGLVLPPTPAGDTATIFTALDRLRAGGSTAGAAGIELAYQTATAAFLPNGNNRVVLATDGDFNVGTRSQDALVKLIEAKRETGVYLTVLGFGHGNYHEGRMQALAGHGNGNHGYIDSPLEARKLLVEEFHGTINTVAKDVKLQLAFDPRYVRRYRLIGYENRLLATEDFDDDTKDAAEMGEGHQVTALYELELTRKAHNNRDLGELRLRYKAATGGPSKKLTLGYGLGRRATAVSARDARWAAAVAEFGLLLRDSPHRGAADWSGLLVRARANVGPDPDGYRAEMIELVERAAALVEVK